MPRLPASLAAFALASLLATAALPSSAHACKCMFPPLESARADATAVFEGRVVAIREQVDPQTTLGHNYVTLAVVRTWKGLDRDERIEIITNNQSAACGYEFAKDTSYLVFARENEGKLTVSACSRTKQLAEAKDDLKALGAGATPVSIGAKTLVPDAGVLATADAGPVATIDAGASVARDAGSASAKPPQPKPRGGCASSGTQAGFVGGWIAILPALALTFRRKRRR